MSAESPQPEGLPTPNVGSCENAEQYALRRLHQVEETMRPAQLAEEYGCTPGHMQDALHNLLETGAVVRVDTGEYTHSNSEIAESEDIGGTGGESGDSEDEGVSMDGPGVPDSQTVDPVEDVDVDVQEENSDPLAEGGGHPSPDTDGLDGNRDSDGDLDEDGESDSGIPIPVTQGQLFILVGAVVVVLVLWSRRRQRQQQETAQQDAEQQTSAGGGLVEWMEGV